MLLLTDQSMEIPAFLLRNSDGSFAYKNCAVPFTIAVSAFAQTDALAEAIATSKSRDDAVRKMLLHQETMSAKERQTEQTVMRKAQKETEKSRLLKNKLKQREVFIQHFKWDHEQ